MTFRAALGGALLALVPALAGLPSISPAHAEGSPLHGLWRVTAGPAQAGDSCSYARRTWYSQISDFAAGGWLSLWNYYASQESKGLEVSANYVAAYDADNWTNPPPQSVLDQINAAQIPIAFSGTLSADGRVLQGKDSAVCLYWDSESFNGHQVLSMPIRAERVPYTFGSITPEGVYRYEFKQGETFYLDFETEEHLGWDSAWVRVWDSDPTLWIRLDPDAENSRYLSQPLTISKPSGLNLDLPAEALDGRLYAEAGQVLEFMIHPNLTIFSITVLPAE